ncbi:hypothetical protein XELAEV_18001173mg [Xenopus laevis]|nr:hypothetical protein XELAEV_18001173mg [Xenopus laevis]
MFLIILVINLHIFGIFAFYLNCAHTLHVLFFPYISSIYTNIYEFRHKEPMAHIVILLSVYWIMNVDRKAKRQHQYYRIAWQIVHILFCCKPCNALLMQVFMFLFSFLTL